jgi:hypothetical protein
MMASRYDKEREIRTRESEQDQENKGVLMMEVCSERELLQETWLERPNSSAYL